MQSNCLKRGGKGEAAWRHCFGEPDSEVVRRAAVSTGPRWGWDPELKRGGVGRVKVRDVL
eukprot:2213440-Rhodomonas_salina.4